MSSSRPGREKSGMEVPEPSRSHGKRYSEEGSDMKGSRAGDEEDSEKRKHRSGKSRKASNVEEAEEDSGGRRKSTGDRKRPSGSSRGGSGDEDDYEARKEMRSKQIRKNPDERPEKITSSGYQDRELESSRKSRDGASVKGNEVADEGERESLRKSSSKTAGHESSQSKSRSKMDISYDGETEKMRDRDSRYPERKESSRDKAHVSREPDRNSRQWNESDPVRKREGSDYMDRNDSRSGKGSDVKHGSSKERSDLRHELSEIKSRALELKIEKAVKSNNDEEKIVDRETNKSRGRSEVQEEDSRKVQEEDSRIREEKLGDLRDYKQRIPREKPSGLIEDPEFNDRGSRGHGDKNENYRRQIDLPRGGHDAVESRERSINTNEDGRARGKEGSGREAWSPERSGRHRQQSEYESDNERTNGFKTRDQSQEGYGNDRSKGRDNSWSDRNRDREESKDNWNRRQNNDNFRETTYGEKGWESQRRGRERIDNDRLNNRPGYRKNNRTEGGKNYGSTDSIEIRPQFHDDGSEDLEFAGKKIDAVQKRDLTSTSSDDQWVYPFDNRSRAADMYSNVPGEDPQERYTEDGSPMLENSERSNIEIQGEIGQGQSGVTTFSRTGGGPSPSSGSPFGNNQGSGGFGRGPPLGAKGNRFGRGGRGRMPGRDVQRIGLPMPNMMGPPFGSLALPPGPMQPLGPNMSPVPPPIGVFIPQFTGPGGWPGARGVDMNILGVPPGFSPIPPGPSPSRFPPNMGNGPNPALYFNQPGPVRGMSPSMPGPVFNPMGAMGRGIPHDKGPGGWAPPRNSDPPGKAPSRGEQNDYSQNFVDTGLRPQNFIRELEPTSVVEDYPKLRELIQKKDEIVAKSVTAPMYYKCDLREFALSPEFFGTKFDVILVDPPWEEYVHRAPGVADNMEYWTFEEIMNLNIEAIADTPSFIFLWVGDGLGLEQGRKCLKKWGFRRCEDICWVKTNKLNVTPGLQHDANTLFQHSKEHCLMGIKGTVRRGIDGHIIHANIDTDIIIAEEFPYGSTKKPEDMYRIIEHFSLGRRRLELFGEDRNIRSGWLTLGKGLSSSNFNTEGYTKNFADKDGKVWQGGGGRNPPPGAPHLVVTTLDIEGLRPKSPPPKNQQPLQSTSLSTTANSTNRRPTGNSPQDYAIVCVNQEVNSSTPTTPAHWGAGLKPPEILALPPIMPSDGFGYNL